LNTAGISSAETFMASLLPMARVKLTLSFWMPSSLP